MRDIFKSLLISGMVFFPLSGADPFSFNGEQELQITVNNRILAKVNGKAISVVDLIKKLDMQFYRQFPQYAAFVQARYQFYQANWRFLLEELIDKELILAEAQELKLPISAGDVRQEMEQLFGPNIIMNLDKIDLSFDEAYKMVQADLIIRRMMYIRIQSKAINAVTPQVVRNYYETYAKDNIRDNEWAYRVISIRHRDAKKAQEMAKQAHHLLAIEKLPVAELQTKLAESWPALQRTPSLTISEEYHHKEKELSQAFKATVAAMEPDSYSPPISQKSRADNSTVYRIFYLKDMTPGGIIPFSELENVVRNTLIEQAIAKESDLYLTKLRKHYDVQEAPLQEILASDMPPFILQ